MKIDYSRFEYKGAWYGEAADELSNNKITVKISSGDSKAIPDESKEALEWFTENHEAMQDELLEKILEYYCDERINLGYDTEENEDFPSVSSTDEIADMIAFRAITIPDQKRFKRGVFLVYDCSWDAEEGLGIRIVDGQITAIGDQGIAL